MTRSISRRCLSVVVGASVLTAVGLWASPAAHAYMATGAYRPPQQAVSCYSSCGSSGPAVAAYKSDSTHLVVYGQGFTPNSPVEVDVNGASGNPYFPGQLWMRYQGELSTSSYGTFTLVLSVPCHAQPGYYAERGIDDATNMASPWTDTGVDC